MNIRASLKSIDSRVKVTDLLSLFKTHPVVHEVAGFLSAATRDSVSEELAGPGEPGPAGKKNRLNLTGLSGSSRAMVMASVFDRTTLVHLAVLPDRESAAYFFNDLQQILGDRVFFFPSSFKKGFHSGVKDNQGLLSRTEVLN